MFETVAVGLAMFSMGSPMSRGGVSGEPLVGVSSANQFPVDILVHRQEICLTVCAIDLSRAT